MKCSCLFRQAQNPWQRPWKWSTHVHSSRRGHSSPFQGLQKILWAGSGPELSSKLAFGVSAMVTCIWGSLLRRPMLFLPTSGTAQRCLSTPNRPEEAIKRGRFVWTCAQRVWKCLAAGSGHSLARPAQLSDGRQQQQQQRREKNFCTARPDFPERFSLATT